MASRRKAWSELSPAYRERLARHGIGPEQHARGESIRSARGHRITPERKGGYERRAIELGLPYVIPEYDELRDDMSQEERNQLARDYVLGFLSKGSIKSPTVRNNARITARMRVMQFVRDNGGEFDRENWRAFRAAYNQHFGGSQA